MILNGIYVNKEEILFAVKWDGGAGGIYIKLTTRTGIVSDIAYKENKELRDKEFKENFEI